MTFRQLIPASNCSFPGFRHKPIGILSLDPTFSNKTIGIISIVSLADP